VKEERRREKGKRKKEFSPAGGGLRGWNFRY
jgi:hypothetical protein